MRRFVSGAVLAASVLGCTSGGGMSTVAISSTSSSSVRPGGSSSAPAADLTIYAAASLSGVLDAATIAYETAHPGSRLTVSTDSSAALETKIEQGAPADVFLAADTTNPKKLVDGGFAAGGAVDFAGNQLTVVVPKENPGRVSTPADLARSGVKVVAAGDEVPITKYANQLLENLAKIPGYPSDFKDAYEQNVVSKEDNVKSVVAKVGLGEGDAGIAYITDALASKDVETVPIPDEANVPVTYAGIVVKASSHADAAKAFLDWISGPDGQAILHQSGFLPPPS